MTIYVNGKEDVLSSALTVDELLSRNKVENPDMVSVQLNGEILKRNTFLSTSINDGDKVEFLYFMGGGV